MKKSNLFLLIVLCGTIAESSFASNSTYYISKNGQNHTSCIADISRPWKTLRAIKDRCLKAGDTISFLPGEYTFNEIENGDLSVNKDKNTDSPIIISAYTSTEKWPVKFKGDGFNITSGGPITLKGIEIERDPASTSSRALLAIGISNVTIADNYIHGKDGTLEEIIDNPTKRSNDCIYAPSNTKYVENLAIRGNIIKNCSQDAIDFPGARNIEISNNTISQSLEIQIKGGAENIKITNNKIYSMVYGIIGGGMACSFYCGAPDIPEINVKDRFNAKNISIKNNQFSDIRKGWIINFTGWKDAEITGNYIEHNKTYPQELFAAGPWGSQYFDDLAKKYCASNEEFCSECTSKPQDSREFCAKIYLPPTEIRIEDNEIRMNTNLLLAYSEVDSNKSESDICMNNKVLEATSSEKKSFAIKKRIYSDGSLTKEESVEPNQLSICTNNRPIEAVKIRSISIN